MNRRRLATLLATGLLLGGLVVGCDDNDTPDRVDFDNDEPGPVATLTEPVPTSTITACAAPCWPTRRTTPPPVRTQRPPSARPTRLKPPPPARRR